MSSSREREILERQKLIAASRPNQPPPPPPLVSKKATTSSSNLHDECAPVKPSSKRPTSKRPSSSIAILAAARSDAQKQQQHSAAPPKLTVDNGKPSPKFVRKHVTLTDGGSKAPRLLSQLVQNATATSSSSSSNDNPSNSFPTIQPEDFWKKLRDWDVLTHYYQVMQGKPVASTSKPLPDTFINARHYMAAWAPLCIAECRAQLLQEIPSNTPGIAVACTTSGASFHRGGGRRNQKQDNLSYYDLLSELDDTAAYVELKIPPSSTGAATPSPPGSFSTNDLVLLLLPDYEHILRDLSRKKTVAFPKDNGLNDYNAAGLLGHVEQARASLHGLVIKVSKRKWAQIGQPKMIAVPWKGGNVTALREFTALCRMETLPLKRFLLGQHLLNGTSKKVMHTLDSQQLLDRMGGREALGKGFVEYATKKFNSSQLTAIAASANQYGEGGFTLIKGPPGTGKTTTLVAVLNSLHIRQYNKYYEEVRRIAALPTGARSAALELARKAKPRLLCCAPSNTAVDNIILKIMEDGFIDGQGQRYNPSVIRVGVGQSANVRAVALETKVDAILSEHMDAGKLESSIAGYRSELSRITSDIALLRQKCNAIVSACPWPLSRDWEIRINEARFDTKKGVFFVNHKDQTTSYEVPPPPEPGETQFPAKSMPEYRAYMARIVKLVENYFSVKTHLERCTIVKGATDNGANHFEIQQNMENHVLNSVHIVLTTLGSAGGRAMEGIDKFEVVVIDEAAQSVEPQSLSALQLGNRHAVLVGDPQQLPATIFSVSGKTTKYDRSLFQRLEEAGELVYMLNEQYRMHPKISHFPRHIFYDGTLLDGPNVRKDGYGNPLLGVVRTAAPSFQPFTILDLDSAEQRDGTSLANPDEARLAVHLYLQLTELSRGLSNKTRVAVITPYAQQSRLLQRFFENALGPEYKSLVEVNTVDAFQGREANIVIFSAVRGSGSQGIGFLADVRRMNVALTRAKHMLFVIARCQSIVINPYWHDLVDHAKETKAVIRVPFTGSGDNLSFGPVNNWVGELPAATTVRPVAVDPRRAKSTAMKLPRADPRKAAATKSAFQASEAIQRSGDGAETTALHRPRADPRKAVTSKQAAKASGVAGSCDPRIKTKEAATAAVNVAKPRDPRMKTIVSEGRKRTAPVPSSSKPVDPRKRGRGYQL